MKANLCKCNNCDTILIDQNPQIGAKEYTLQGVEQEMQFVDGEDDKFWVCPVCETDDFLVDL